MKKNNVISIPLRFNYNPYSSNYFCCCFSISIPLRFNYNLDFFSPRYVKYSNFNSTKVQL